MICADKSFFRDVKDNPPSALRRAAGFSLCAAFSGAHKKMNAAHSLFPRKPRYWQTRLRCGKARFSLRERVAFTKKRRAVGAFFREFEGKPERFSPRRAILQGTQNMRSRGFTLSVSRGIGKSGERAKSAVFARSEIKGFTKTVCADESFFRDVKDNPPPALRRVGAFFRICLHSLAAYAIIILQSIIFCVS